MQAKRIARVRMRKRHRARVQRQPVQAVARAEQAVVLAPAVVHVADQRVSQMLQVPADLVEASGSRVRLHERIGDATRVGSVVDRHVLHHVKAAKARHGGDALRAGGLVARERMIDDAFLRRAAAHEGEVPLRDRPLLELPLHPCGGLPVEREEEDPAGAAIEAVDRIHPPSAERTRQVDGHLVVVAPAAVREQAGRLRDREYVVVLVEERERGLGHGVESILQRGSVPGNARLRTGTARQEDRRMVRSRIALAFLAVALPLAACKSRGEKATPTPTPDRAVQAAGSASPAAAKVPAGDRLLYYERAVTPADLEGRTLRELTLMRNWIYARAGNVFRKEWLHEFFTQQSWYSPTGLDMSRLSEVDRRNAEAIAAAEASIPRAELTRRLDAFAKNEPGTPEEWIEAALLARALGVESAFGEELWERTPLDDPKLLTQQLTVEQLRDLSRRDLRLLRNMVFARHGREFKSELVRGHFERMEWYRPDPRYSDSRLTALDHRNIKVIQSVEADLGGPIGDHEELEFFEGA